jgi:hypothetical protein
MLTCFSMIWNCDNFFKKTHTKFGKICTLSNSHIYSKLVVEKHMTYWGNYQYNK